MYDRKKILHITCLMGIKRSASVKLFWLTLWVSHYRLYGLLSTANDGFIPPDQRGKHGQQCKLQPEVIQAVNNQINSKGWKSLSQG